MVKEAEHKFLFYLCEKYQKLPDDPFFEEMEPWVKLWLWHAWKNKVEEEFKTQRAAAILTGSFSNPEAANYMYKKENPDTELDDKEFEESWAIVERASKELEQQENEIISNKKHRRARKRKKVINNG